jgi:hypothetical protein
MAAALVAVAVVLAGCNRDTVSPSPSQPSPATTISVSVTGTVTDTNGIPLPDVMVRSADSRGDKQALTDSAGRYGLGLEFLPGAQFTLVAEKSGFRTATIQIRAEQSSIVRNLRLTEVLVLPMDASITAQLTPLDPPQYVGEAYESAYTWNTKLYSFVTPAAADLSVELSWERTGNAALKMWALGGALESEPKGDRLVIVLPKGTEDTLFVGQPNEALRQAVTYTLVTRRIPE